MATCPIATEYQNISDTSPSPRVASKTVTVSNVRVSTINIDAIAVRADAQRSLVYEDVEGYDNTFTRLLAKCAADDLTAASVAMRKPLDNIVAWADTDSIELIADYFPSHKRLELFFEDNSVLVRRVSDCGVIEYPRTKRPYTLLDHINWLLD